MARTPTRGPESITSPANPLLRDIRQAVARAALTNQGWWVAETFHLLEEALRSDCEVKVVVAAESVLPAVEEHVRAQPGVRLAVVSDRLMGAISATQSSQGVIALVKPPEWRLEQFFDRHALLLVLDALQDPGNCGTIVRAAEAFAATGVIFLKGTASPHNPKTLRASAGSLFRVPFLHAMEAAQARALLEQHDIEIYAGVSAAAGARPLPEADLTSSCALIIGNEAHGVGSELCAAARQISIPTVGVESLNAAVAASVMLYEAQRQRSRW